MDKCYVCGKPVTMNQSFSISPKGTAHLECLMKLSSLDKP